MALVQRKVFNKKNFEFMDDLIDNNCTKILRKHKNYVLINERISNIIDEAQTLPENIKQLFNEFASLLYKNSSYDYCLLYHLGIKQGKNK